MPNSPLKMDADPERWPAVAQADRAYWAKMSCEERLRITLSLLDFALNTGLY